MGFGALAGLGVGCDEEGSESTFMGSEFSLSFREFEPLEPPLRLKPRLKSQSICANEKHDDSGLEHNIPVRHPNLSAGRNQSEVEEDGKCLRHPVNSEKLKERMSVNLHLCCIKSTRKSKRHRDTAY